MKVMKRDGRTTEFNKQKIIEEIPNEKHEDKWRRCYLVIHLQI